MKDVVLFIANQDCTPGSITPRDFELIAAGALATAKAMRARRRGRILAGTVFEAIICGDWQPEEEGPVIERVKVSRKVPVRKAPGCVCLPKRRADQQRTNPYCRANHIGSQRGAA